MKCESCLMLVVLPILDAEMDMGKCPNIIVGTISLYIGTLIKKFIHNNIYLI